MIRRARQLFKRPCFLAIQSARNTARLSVALLLGLRRCCSSKGELHRHGLSTCSAASFLFLPRKKVSVMARLATHLKAFLMSTTPLLGTLGYVSSSSM